MFKLVKNLAAWWPVSVLEPDPDQPGKLLEHSFEAQFIIRGKEEMKGHNERRQELTKQLMEAIGRAGTATADEADAINAEIKQLTDRIEAHDRSMFHLMVANWRGVIGEDDQPIPFSAAALDGALDHDRIRVGLNRAYEEAISNDKARLGNSKTSPAPGL